MKKHILSIIIIFTLAAGIFMKQPVYASDSEDYLPDDCFYLSPDEQEEWYDFLMNYDFSTVTGAEILKEDAIILKDSIYAEYNLDYIEYANSGKIVLSRDDGRGDKAYAAKVVDSKGNYKATIWIYQSHIGFTDCVVSSLDNDDNRYLSCDYADNAERISKLLGVDYIIPATDVRHVEFSWYIISFGGYWIKHKDIETFVLCGYVSEKDETDPDYIYQVQDAKLVMSMQDVRDKCIELAEIDRQEREIWGEKYDNGEVIYGGPDSGITIPYVTGVNSITNITEYLHLDEVKWTKKHGFKPIYAIAGGGAILIAAGIVTAIRLSKRRKQMK